MKKETTIESAVEKSKQYFNGDELAASVFHIKLLTKKGTYKKKHLSICTIAWLKNSPE